MKKSICFIVFLCFCLTVVNSDYIELRAFLDELDAVMEWDYMLDTGVLIKNTDRIVFKIGAPWIILNYHKKVNTPGIIRQQGAVLIPQQTAEVIKEFFNKPSQISYYRVAAIVIDPGHGGKDPGACYTYSVGGKSIKVAEKDVVLQVSKYLYEMLSKKYPNKIIKLTRDNDTFISLEGRPEIANKIPTKANEAIIYISLHANASANKKARGFEVWYLTPTHRRELIEPAAYDDEHKEILPILNTMKEEEYTWESVILAKDILDSLNASIGNMTENRGLKEGRWVVVRKAKMPSILIELGFVSNKEEALELNNEYYLKKLSQAIYNGVCSFTEKLEKSKAFME
ncbi:MAG: N-acetylmuramoyl-L-alanine amidase [Spirochaetales bacterium]|nr:N-acetylmuramoyl-L-alanine amidase [Spirochaetales bacterium]